MRFLGGEKPQKFSHISQIELFMEIDEGHGRVFWGFTQQCEGNVKRGGQEKGAGQLPGALGEGALLGFGRGASPLCPSGVGWQKAGERGRALAREIAVYQRTHTECAPKRESEGAQPPPRREPEGAQPPAGLWRGARLFTSTRTRSVRRGANRLGCNPRQGANRKGRSP